LVSRNGLVLPGADNLAKLRLFRPCAFEGDVYG
jgi:hypothetical protein